MPKTVALSTQPVMDLASLLQRLVQIAASSSESNTLVAEVATALGEAFQVGGCIIAFSTAAQTDKQVACWLSGSKTFPSPHSHILLASFARRLTCSEPVVIPDLQSLSLSNTSVMGFTADELVAGWQFVLAPMGYPKVRALLEVTTQFQGTVNGMISLMRSQPYNWTASEVETLNVVSQQVAIILSRLELQQQVSQQAQYQQVVNQLTMAIRRSSDLGETLKLATDGTAQALQVSRGMLLRLKYWDPPFQNYFPEQPPWVKVTVTCEWLSDVKKSEPVSWQSPSTDSSTSASPLPALNQSFWMSECKLCQQAFSHSPKVTVVNHQQYLSGNDAAIAASPTFNLAKMPALLIAPLESQGTVLGFLVFEHHQPRSWRTKEIELVELVSAQVSTAIIQTETVRQVQGLVETRTAELQQSITVQAKLYQRTREQVDQLRRLNQLKDEFLDTVSHELRTPLTTMTLAIRMLRQVGLSSDRSAQYLDILEQQCAQETNLVNDLLALQELESHKATIQLEDLNLLDLLQELAVSFRQKWAVKGLVLELDFPNSPCMLHSDRDSLNQIFLELLTNAGKYSEPSSRICLKMIRQQEPTKQIVLTLSSIGAGIPPEELPHIFEKFRRCQGATQNAIQGTGLGLALVKSLLENLNGTISASSTPTEDPQVWETRFTLTLPQSLGR